MYDQDKKYIIYIRVCGAKYKYKLINIIQKEILTSINCSSMSSTVPWTAATA